MRTISEGARRDMELILLGIDETLGAGSSRNAGGCGWKKSMECLITNTCSDVHVVLSLAGGLLFMLLPVSQGLLGQTKLIQGVEVALAQT